MNSAGVVVVDELAADDGVQVEPQPALLQRRTVLGPHRLELVPEGGDHVVEATVRRVGGGELFLEAQDDLVADRAQTRRHHEEAASVVVVEGELRLARHLTAADDLGVGERHEAVVDPESDAERHPAGSSSSSPSAVTVIATRSTAPNVVVIATSAASRPRPITVRPTRRWPWLRGSNVYQRSDRYTSVHAQKSIGVPGSGTAMSGR